MKINKILASAVSLFMAFTVGATCIYADNASLIKSKLNTAKKNLETTKSKQSDALAELQRLDAQLNEVQGQLDVISNNLTSTTKRLNEKQEELKQAIDDRENQYESLKSRVKIMYENGNSGYLDIILDSEGFGDFVKRVEYVNAIMDYDQNLLSEYEKNETIIADNVKTITEDKRNLEKLEQEQKDKKATLDANIAQKNEIVKKLNADVSTYEQQIKDLEKQDKEVQAIIAASKKKAASSAKNTGSSSASSNRVYAASKGQFMYPVPRYSGYRPNSGYGYRSSPISGRSEFHTGVDLKATLNTDVVASASGTVIYAGNRGGYGKCVIIDHGGGFSTLYAHNNALVVRVGQSVQKGQVISKAGTTGYSTGVHLHFEIRKNGQHINPTPYIY